MRFEQTAEPLDLPFERTSIGHHRFKRSVEFLDRLGAMGGRGFGGRIEGVCCRMECDGSIEEQRGLGFAATATSQELHAMFFHFPVVADEQGRILRCFSSKIS